MANLRLYPIACQLVVLLLMRLLFSCKKEKIDPQSEWDASVVQIIDPNNPIVLVAVTPDKKESVTLLGEKNGSGIPIRYTSIIVSFDNESGSGNFVVEIGQDTLPAAIFDEEGYRVEFSNYSGNSVTLTGFNPNGNVVSGPEVVQVDLAGLQDINESYAPADETDCDIRQRPIITTLQWTGLFVSWASCAAGAMFASGGLGATLAVLSCANLAIAIVNQFANNDALAFLTSFLDQISCVGVIFDLSAILDCINVIINAAIGFLENDCAYIGGTWTFYEDGFLSCDLTLNGEMDHLFELIGDSGEITIEQEECNFKWLAGGLVIREGYIEKNKIVLNQGVGAVPLAGNVEFSVNEYSADGHACRFHLFIEGEGHIVGTAEENQETLSFDCETKSTVILVGVD
ncbi:MAG: hypothetical protein IPJ00_12760 [Saprospirales bacterium]|nr:hypothetical protein [Saprospirales bacterium]